MPPIHQAAQQNIGASRNQIAAKEQQPTIRTEFDEIREAMELAHQIVVSKVGMYPPALSNMQHIGAGMCNASSETTSGSAHINGMIAAHAACAIKLSRLQYHSTHLDSWFDLVNYAVFGLALALRQKTRD